MIEFQIVVENGDEYEKFVADNLEEASIKAFDIIKLNKENNGEELLEDEEFKLYYEGKCAHFTLNKKDNYKIKRWTFTELLKKFNEKEKNDIISNMNFDSLSGIESHGIDTSEFAKEYHDILQKNQLKKKGKSLKEKKK